MLLVLDGVGSNATLQAQVTEFVSALLRRTRDPRVLVSSEHTITSMLTDAQKVYPTCVVAADTLGSQLLPQIVSIYPLRNIHAAALFTALAPRKLRLEEMGATDNRTALLQFSKHPLIVVRDCSCRVLSGLMLLGCIPFSHRRSPMLAGQKLGGHPKAIASAVSLLQDQHRDVTYVYQQVDHVLTHARAPERVRVRSRRTDHRCYRCGRLHGSSFPSPAESVVRNQQGCHTLARYAVHTLVWRAPAALTSAVLLSCLPCVAC